MSTDLVVIEAALKAATESPWFVDAPDRVFVGNRADGRSAGLFEIIYGSDDVLSDLHSAAAVRALANAHLIANAPSWLAELVERVRVAEAAIERVRALLGDDSRKFIRAGEVSDAIEGREAAGDWCDSMCEVCRCCPHEWATNCHCPDPDCGCLLVCQCALCVDGDA